MGKNKMQCPECGSEDVYNQECDDCYGDGLIEDDDGELVSCEWCDGNGYIIGWLECGDCGYCWDEGKE